MSKINEILTSVVLYSILSYILNLPNFEYGLLLALVGSQINILLPKNYKHTLIFFIPLYILSLLYPTIIIPIMVGYSSSILIGLISKNACKLLYPIRETTFTGPKNYLENDSKKDYAATAFLITLVVITLLLSFNGMEILDDLHEENNFNDYFNNPGIQYNDTPEAVQYININPAYCVNKNITTIKLGNTTTTLITEYNS
jgi:hypothetical protein